MGYLGFLSGPPLIGFVADASGLSAALSLVIVTGAIIATVGAVIVREASTTHEGAPLTSARNSPVFKARNSGRSSESGSREVNGHVFPVGPLFLIPQLAQSADQPTDVI